MALGGVLKKDFGTPTAIFAPDPAVQKEDVGRKYDYVRPLATIEPAAISYGLPVDASIGVMDVAALAKALDAPALQGALVFVAWEHKQLVAVTRFLVKEHGGHAADVPDWGPRGFRRHLRAASHAEWCGDVGQFYHDARTSGRAVAQMRRGKFLSFERPAADVCEANDASAQEREAGRFRDRRGG